MRKRSRQARARAGSKITDLPAPLSNRRHHVNIDVLADAAKNTSVFHDAAMIDENRRNRESVEAGRDRSSLVLALAS